MGNFAFTTQKLKLEQSAYIGMNVLLEEFGQKVKELIKPIEKNLQSKISEKFKERTTFDTKKLCEEKYFKDVQGFTNNIISHDNRKIISDAIKDFKTEMGIDQEQINAFRIATKFEKFES